MYRLSSGPIRVLTLVFGALLIITVCSQRSFSQTSPHGSLKQPCTDCHTTQSWKELATPMKFSHTATGFPLSGAHSNTNCIQCHTTKRFTGTTKDCFSCHQSDYSKALTPNHVLGKFSHDCIACHTNNQWLPSNFQHSKTNFQLMGAHRTVECTSCHTNDRFAGLQTDCYSCHQKEYAATVTPSHSAAGFSHECLTCHTMNGWEPSTFDHNKTNFRLVGVHRTLECSSCHSNGKFKGIAADCYSCHQKEYIATLDPNHATAQFNHDCSTCHTTLTWKPSTFGHNKTNFQLKGAHTTAECSSCHTNGQFKGISIDCYPCHQTQFTKTLTPNHVTGQFSNDCLTCHTELVWKPSTFDHNKTNFQLKGAHNTAECSSCHINGQFKGISIECYPCHQTQFAATIVPNHLIGQFSHDCTVCHTTSVWKPSTFSHAQTNFPLTGAHIITDCIFCHKNDQYKGTAGDCYSCHQMEFSGVADPNHLSGNFDHNCTTCHTTNAWAPALFDHNKTNFRLTGAHTITQCSSCHAGGKFSGTSTDCFACHQQQYTATTNPAHAVANYPTACISCHTTTAWKPSTFDHTPMFPINAGSKHRPGRWTTCADCHTNPANFKVFSCLTCHEHNQTSMDDKHRGRTGYAYESNACYRCHPTGNGG